MKHLVPSVTHAMPPLLPSLQMTPIVRTGCPEQPSAWGQGVVMRGGTHTVVHAQAALFSLPQYCEDCTVLAGHSTAGFAGHSASAHGRKLTLVPADSSDQVHGADELAAHSTFAALASEEGIAPQASKLQSPLALKVWGREPPALGLLASSLPLHAARTDNKLHRPMMCFI